MTTSAGKSGLLLASKAPNLPIAPVQYTQQYQDQVLNALRLYFNQIDNFTQAVVNPLSGPTSDRPLNSVQAPLPIGQPYFDTTLNGLVIWNGSTWVSATPTGTSVTTFSAGTTGLTPNTATTGAITLAGILNAANGGTGVSSLSGIAYGNGASPMTAATGAQVVAVIGATAVTNATNATTATTATTANNLNTGNNYQINSLGVGTAASGTAGEIRATNNITAYYSDDRLKTNLGNIPNALEKIKTLNGFYYEANEVAQALGYEVKKEIGVSAQQVQAVLPEVVAPAPIDDQYLTVRYERLVPLLIEAIKELEAKVELLQSQK